MTTALFTNARLITPTEVIAGTLSARDGLIASIDASPSRHREGVDCEGDYLMPGAVELHTDNLERHLMPRPKVGWPPLPALLAHDAEIAAAGITTVFDALGVGDDDETDLRSQHKDGVLRIIDAATREHLLRAEHFVHVRCELPTRNVVQLFAPFERSPVVGLISLMDHTPGQRQWTNLDRARVYWTGKKGWSAERFEAHVAAAPDRQARYSDRHRAYFLDYARRRRVAVATHDDTTAAHVVKAHAEGTRICEFPTTLAAARRAHKLGLATVMGAPNIVRGGSHAGNVAAIDLARRGYLDILSSDYVPASLLQGAFLLVEQAGYTLAQAIATVTVHPARAVGLLDRGTLEVGMRADLVRVRVIDGYPVVRAVWRGGLQVV